MFVLRQIIERENGDAMELNVVLGESYNVIHKDKAPVEFNRALSVHQYDPSKLRAIIVYADGASIYPIYNSKGYAYYIMNDKGGTFSKI